MLLATKGFICHSYRASHTAVIFFKVLIEPFLLQILFSPHREFCSLPTARLRLGLQFSGYHTQLLLHIHLGFVCCRIFPVEAQVSVYCQCHKASIFKEMNFFIPYSKQEALGVKCKTVRDWSHTGVNLHWYQVSSVQLVIPCLTGKSSPFWLWHLCFPNPLGQPVFLPTLLQYLCLPQPQLLFSEALDLLRRLIIGKSTST